MPAITTTTELFPRTAFTLEQVKEQRDLRIQASAIRSTIDNSDPTNFILVTEWNVLGGNEGDENADAIAVDVAPQRVPEQPTVPGTGLALELTGTLTSQQNVRDLAALITSEASVGNAIERVCVGFTVLNRLAKGSLNSVRQIWSAYAHNQVPTAAISALAQQLLLGQRTDLTGGATHFYSPVSMPKEGQSTAGYDVASGLEMVPPLQARNYAPSWAKTMEYVDVEGVRPAYFKFFR